VRGRASEVEEVRGFRSGEFNRGQVLGLFRPFCPSHAFHTLLDVDLDGLLARGKKLLLLDVDNTLVKWRSEDFAQETLDWIEDAKSKGFHICILSNTRNPQRLERVSKRLGVMSLRGRWKPSRAMYHQAIEHFNVRPSEAIMIGDQLFTDILGANRSGIEAVWLQPVSNVDFAGTKISRMGERVLRNFIYQALIEPPDAEPEAPAIESAKPFLQRTIVKQVARFTIVGGTSFVIDAALTLILIKYVSFHGHLLSETTGQWVLNTFPSLQSKFGSPIKASTPILGGIASFVAMFNSFVWNRYWTFSVRRSEQRTKQLRRFYEISIVGAIINAFITTAVFNALSNHSNKSLLLAKVAAAAIVAVWNFVGQRFYAFRPSHQ
jgi:hypothetical protein